MGRNGRAVGGLKALRRIGLMVSARFQGNEGLSQSRRLLLGGGDPVLDGLPVAVDLVEGALGVGSPLAKDSEPAFGPLHAG